MSNTLREQATAALATVTPTTPYPMTQKIRAIQVIRRTPGFGHHGLRELADAVGWAMDQAETTRLLAEMREPIADQD